MLSKRILTLVFVVAFLTLLIGCFPVTPPIVENQEPIITSTPVTTATVGVTYVYDVNATDPDGDTLTYSLTVKHSSMTIDSANGLIKWTPTAKGDYPVIVKVSDGSLSITQSFTITVSKPTPTPINHAPVIYSTPITTATVGVTYVYDVEATDPDGDTLTYSLTTYPSGMTISSATGLVMWTPTAKENYPVVVKVSDGSLSITQSFTITVSKPTSTPINHAPVITSTPNLNATVGVKYTYTIKAIDPDGDTVTYSLVSRPTGMTFNGIATINWIPTKGQVGVYGVTVKASDGKLSHTQSFSITVSAVEAVNQAPTIISDPITTAILGVKYIYGVEATDPDGDTLTYSLTTKPDGMAIDSGTGVISWIPNAKRNYAVVVEVSDGTLSDSQNFTIIVSVVGITRIEVEPEIMTLYVGGSKTIESVTAIYETKKGFEAPIALGDCTYSSSDDTIATVDAGKITAEGVGIATIYVTYAGETDAITVTVLLSLAQPVHNITKDICYATIQLAIDAADPGNTIEVAAGTYDERINISKSLTLKGANAGIPGAGVRGPESIINPEGLSLDFGVLIDGAGTIATFDGFTVENYQRTGILAGAFTLDSDDPAVVHILNNIVTGPIGQHNNNCIQIGDGTTGTIIGNEVSGASLESTDWTGSGILVAGSSDVLVSDNYVHDSESGIVIAGYIVNRNAPAENNLVENNLVENNECGISVQMNSIGTIIRYNDVFNNTDVGIEPVGNIYWEPTIPSGTEIHNNNIVGNVNYGVKSSVWDESLGEAEQVDATNNWWGSEYGPKFQGHPANGGDAVSDNVDYSDWSTRKN